MDQTLDEALRKLSLQLRICARVVLARGTPMLNNHKERRKECSDHLKIVCYKQVNPKNDFHHFQ